MPRSTSGRRMRTSDSRASRAETRASYEAWASATDRSAWATRAWDAETIPERSAIRDACSACSIRIWSATAGLAAAG